MDKILVIGSGGLAREFSDYFGNQVNIVGYSTCNPDEHQKFSLVGRVFGDDISPEVADTNLAIIAIGNPARRKIISDRLFRLGFCFPSFIHPSSTVSHKAKIGQGVVISPQCTVSPNVVIGDFTYINYSCGIGHETVIGQYVQVNPGAQIGGNSTVGNTSLIGSGAVIIDNITVGANAKIASGAAVLTPVEDNASMFGNPAKRMRAFEQ